MNKSFSDIWVDLFVPLGEAEANQKNFQIKLILQFMLGNFLPSYFYSWELDSPRKLL